MLLRSFKSIRDPRLEGVPKRFFNLLYCYPFLSSSTAVKIWGFTIWHPVNSLLHGPHVYSPFDVILLKEQKEPTLLVFSYGRLHRLLYFHWLAFPFLSCLSSSSKFSSQYCRRWQVCRYSSRHGFSIVAIVFADVVTFFVVVFVFFFGIFVVLFVSMDVLVASLVSFDAFDIVLTVVVILIFDAIIVVLIDGVFSSSGT